MNEEKITSFLHGHNIELRNGEWFYIDTGETCSVKRNCGFCGKNDTPEGYDGCIGEIKGAMNACCGHGTDFQYVQRLDGVPIYGDEASIILRRGSV